MAATPPTSQSAAAPPSGATPPPPRPSASASATAPATANAPATLPRVDIKPLLQQLWPGADDLSPALIADAISHFFTDQVTEAQAASLLICLHFTGLDRRGDVLAECSRVMRAAAEPIDVPALEAVIRAKGRAEGDYRGGLCDIVGTGGDSHNTFNISTTSSIIASALLLVSKHGNRASTSKSGSADLVNCMAPRPPVLASVTPTAIQSVYAATNYAFLFAPVFHTGMKFVAPIRRQLPWRTIFNNIGPLSNPVEDVLEARVIGVARRELGPAFAEALRIAGAEKALVICGEEELDEVSCAGRTFCWHVSREAPGAEITVKEFTIEPADFGLSRHPLSEVEPGKGPEENAGILSRILHGELAPDHPLIELVLMNTAALLVISGICEADESAMGPGDDGAVVTERGPGGLRWKEGVRRARWAVKSGEAWRQWEKFVNVTNELAQQGA
ncbi:related to anthranilate phosphoribosyltransferase [Cephalotrichum gorgonifer]|uniref:Related to anthranilate phosphoribosyltransferase n=1 Tax=Cephalotrichum gorgonifer TaxID=2041049 RepID=A0AAE8SQU3_9PEZI|nr:related to anthranilate phosphoribosyltransferase [Cephalotrichum gorgonifer]